MGGGGGACPVMLHRSFVGTYILTLSVCVPTRMSFVPTKYICSTNNILKEIAILECENAKKKVSSIAPLARI